MSWPVGKPKISYIFQCAFLGSSPFFAGLKFPPIPSIIRSDYCRSWVFTACQLSERLLSQLSIIVVLLQCCKISYKIWNKMANKVNFLWKLFHFNHHHLKFYIFVVVKSIFQFRLDNINLTNICFAITLLHKMWNKMANTLRGKSYHFLWKIIFIT